MTCKRTSQGWPNGNDFLDMFLAIRGELSGGNGISLVMYGLCLGLDLGVRGQAGFRLLLTYTCGGIGRVGF